MKVMVHLASTVSQERLFLNTRLKEADGEIELRQGVT